MNNTVNATECSASPYGKSTGVGSPVFRQPWEAQAFAIVQVLQDRGLFTRTEWSNALGRAIAKARAKGDADTGETYYLHWIAALEDLVLAKGVAQAAQLSQYQDAWGNAAERTPHGSAIDLRSEDFRETQPWAGQRP